MSDATTDALREIIEVRAIEILKAKYFRLLDTKQWDAWRALFTDDFKGTYEGPHPDVQFSSADEMVAMNRKILAETGTVHHGHTPEIDLTGADTATGIWAMVDIVKLADGFTGYGHYHDEYRKVNGEWKIAKTHLRRTVVEPGIPREA